MSVTTSRVLSFHTCDSAPRFKPKVIVMVSDFFYPDCGGVEMNIWATAQCLRKTGNKVIVITATKQSRIGVRYMSNIKVYYLPQRRWLSNVVLPTGLMAPILRSILLRERAQIIHVHQCTTAVGVEAFYIGRLLGIPTVYHDHSLFAISDPIGFHVNKLLNVIIRSAVSRVITVSHTNKENLLIRAGVLMENVYVIPNAIDSSQFKPDPTKREPDILSIVTVVRMTYRKGVDLLLEVIPETCHHFPNVRFILGGDGPKLAEVKAMVEREGLEDRVELLGRVQPSQVGALLNRGTIYLNPSLTEAFGISLVEAACAGLYVVSTNVGGIPEVLPREFMTMCDPNPDHMKAVLWDTINRSLDGKLPDVWCISKHCSGLYDWSDVAARTEIVYQHACDQAVERRLPMLVTQAWQGFRMSSIWSVVIWLWFYSIATIAEYIWPRKDLDDVIPYSLISHEKSDVRHSTNHDKSF